MTARTRLLALSVAVTIGGLTSLALPSTASANTTCACDCDNPGGFTFPGPYVCACNPNDCCSGWPPSGNLVCI
jgi:hypothetical protein